ncbi:HAD-IA family hydrolase [Kitasatospora phosalacinea]|uniref:Hydrolase n=1 Tax=Kitasatospora phosalacinea TaxID=2065 RepID=A0A9W6UQH4_9ACTN|nr:HAD-IA family hydrolase [Kitasatospora phosalacinea]GLW58541.1 hypothetical protein Kpho01_65520 [Kitasatospora phosalacinea]
MAPALLFDLNNLFRYFDNTGARLGEETAGLPAGTIDRHAYQHPSYEAAKVGLMTDRQWADGVHRRLADEFGTQTATIAFEPWRADRGRRDETMVDLLGRLRAHGIRCAVLSNFTDALHTDLDLHGIEFDAAFASADLRVTKPSPLAFLTTAQRLGLRPEQIHFFDDQESFVAGARAAGLSADQFTGPAALVQRLAELGIQATDRAAA